LNPTSSSYTNEHELQINFLNLLFPVSELIDFSNKLVLVRSCMIFAVCKVKVDIIDNNNNITRNNNEKYFIQFYLQFLISGPGMPKY
jgi:hypothetical protein